MSDLLNDVYSIMESLEDQQDIEKLCGVVEYIVNSQQVIRETEQHVESKSHLPQFLLDDLRKTFI